MDSLRIKNRRTWFRYSENTGGDAITFLQRFCSKSFPEAVEYLLSYTAAGPGTPPLTLPRRSPAEEERPPFALPPADSRALRGYSPI